MDKEVELRKIFHKLRSGSIPEREILELSSNLDDSDVDWMLSIIKGLEGPHDYFSEDIELEESADKDAEVIVKGFFQFVDLVSGLIIKLGDSGISKAKAFDGGSSEYVPWVLRYCSDARFQKDIKENFPFLGI
ncbi:hypothetical protein [Reinekea blandensis]|uniref:Uncharacterized protein n=1 Tax=Reinekea blandensis MED297 TaxID=314283 RepID=A4BKJ2_9GAMM|nr:hypothetical protein [Reinekea blandensis]EAR07345.1 hypothetical protein MED297_07646 [Reinekea sp. MED297] [Reinekea blandensis MED297]